MSTGATVNHILLREIFKCFNILTCRVNIHVELDKLFCIKFFINRMKILCGFMHMSSASLREWGGGGGGGGPGHTWENVGTLT